MHFLHFQETIDAFLLRMWSITHNKNRVPLLCLVINGTSSKPAPHILSLKDEYTLRLLKFSNNWFV